MTEPAGYQVVYSERVRRHLLRLADLARDRGDGEAFLAALKVFTGGCASTLSSATL